MRAAWGFVAIGACAFACGGFSGSDEAPGGSDGGVSEGGGTDATNGTGDANIDGAKPSSEIALVGGQSDPTSIAANEDFVYWGVSDPGAIRRVSISGGAIEEVDKYNGAPNMISVTKDNEVVWADQSIARQGLYRHVVGGAPMEKIYADDAFAFTRTPQGFAMLARAPRLDIRFFTLGPDGGADGGSVQGYGPYASPFDVTSEGNDVYFTSSGSKRILHADSSNPAVAPTDFLTNEDDCRNILSTPFGLVWTNYSNSVVRLRSGGVTKDIAPGEEHPYALAADASGIYWLTTNGTKGSVRRWKNDVVETIALGFDAPDIAIDNAPYRHALALTSKHVFWLTRFEVRRLEK